MSSESEWVSEWVIKINGLFGKSGHWGPCSPYKPCNNNLYIGIIIFSHIGNTVSRPQLIKKNEGIHAFDLSWEVATLYQFIIILNTKLVPWTETQTVIAHQPQEVKKKR